jgi:hypothetical protein
MPPWRQALAGQSQSENPSAALSVAARCIISIIRSEGTKMMLENPVAKRTAIAAAIGAVVAIPLPFIGPIVGALVGGGIGYFTADQRN